MFLTNRHSDTFQLICYNTFTSSESELYANIWQRMTSGAWVSLTSDIPF